jgi:ankyrin repeat protein
VLVVKYKKYEYVLLISFALFISGCKAEGIDFKSMKSAEESFNERQSKELVAYMSLATMFPDRQVRSLAKAAEDGNIQKIDAIVAEGVNANSQGTKNATPLFWAMRSNNIEGFKRLLELGADPNVVFGDGGTVMHWATQLEDSTFLKIALEHDGDPNLVAGQSKETPLFKTIGMSNGDGDMSALALLLRFGANTNVRTAKGDTPAMVAASLGRFDIVYELLNSGADYSLKNNRGYSLLDRMSSKRNMFVAGSVQEKVLEKVIAWLSERGVTVPE